MQKIVFTAVAISLYQVLPLLGAADLLLHWKMLIVMATAAALWLSQPAIRADDAEANRPTDRHTLWLILAMAGVATIIPELEWAYFKADKAGAAIWNGIGMALVGAGTVFRIWAIRTLGRYFTSTVQTTGEQMLVTTGPYTLVRHPSYLGAFAAILGISVLLQTWVGLAVAAMAMLYAYYRRIAAEESALLAQFGEDYVLYSKKVKKMLPGVW